MNALGNVVTIDQKIAEWFNNNFSSEPLPEGTWSYGNLILCFVAVALCAFLCGLIGMEREKRRRSAGLRTHLLVGLGSCIVMIISIYGFPLTSAQRDVARLAAQVIAGIGFLGAGAIMHNRGGVRGLTTASSVWITMAVGLACGSMNFILAIVAATAALFVLTYFRKAEEKIDAVSPTFILTGPSNQPLMADLNKTALDMQWELSGIHTRIVEEGDSKGSLEITFTVRAVDRRKLDKNVIIEILRSKIPEISIQSVEFH